MPKPGLFSNLFPWRAHPAFTVLTVATGQFSDFFLFGMRVPLLPHLIRTHTVPEDQVQSRLPFFWLPSVSLLSSTAVPAGWLAGLWLAPGPSLSPRAWGSCSGRQYRLLYRQGVGNNNIVVAGPERYQRCGAAAPSGFARWWWMSCRLEIWARALGTVL